MWDIDDKQYIDYVLSWGPMILGHNDDRVTAALHEAVDRGISFGAATEGEVVIAEEIRKLVPSMEEVRLVSSGTEAGMSAIRLARGYTGRNKIVKFEGCYHGHSDSLLVKAGSGLLTFGNPSSAACPPGLRNTRSFSNTTTPNSCAKPSPSGATTSPASSLKPSRGT